MGRSTKQIDASVTKRNKLLLTGTCGCMKIRQKWTSYTTVIFVTIALVTFWVLLRSCRFLGTYGY